MAEKTVMDEVNAALGDAVAPATEEEEVTTETPEGDEPEGDEPEGDEPEGDEPEGDEPEGDEPEGERGPNGERERNPDGTWKKVEAKAEPAKKDHINDPIPENLKKETSERMRGLIEIAKTVTAERDTLKTDFDYIVKGIEATGTTPQQYGEALSWLKLFNSRAPEDQVKALELVETVAERLAMLLGKERTVGDPLKAHADLQEAVRLGKLSPDYAKEIARTRNGQQFRTELTTTATQQQQQQEAAAAEKEKARVDLNSLETTLKGTDTDFEAKKALLLPVLKPIFAAIPPSQWVPKFQEAYRNLKVNAPAAKPKGIPANQPLRGGKQPAGGQTKAPSTMLEAVDAALAGMRK